MCTGNLAVHLCVHMHATSAVLMPTRCYYGHLLLMDGHNRWRSWTSTQLEDRGPSQRAADELPLWPRRAGKDISRAAIDPACETISTDCPGTSGRRRLEVLFTILRYRYVRITRLPNTDVWHGGLLLACPSRNGCTEEQAPWSGHPANMANTTDLARTVSRSEGQSFRRLCRVQVK